MGSGFIAQMARVPGMKVVALADPDVGAARQAFLQTGLAAEQIKEASTPGQAEEAIRAGKRVVTGSCSLVAQLESVDLVTDVTPSPAFGAEMAYAGIQHGKKVVLINIEADVTVGRILQKKAREAGVLYSVSSGDEPGCLMELYEFVTGLGYELMVIGKGKNNYFFQQAKIFMDVSEEVIQIKNGVPNDLPRPMKRNVSSTIDMVKFNSILGKPFFTH